MPFIYRVAQKLLVNKNFIQTLPVSYLSITVTQVYAKDWSVTCS